MKQYFKLKSFLFSSLMMLILFSSNQLASAATELKFKAIPTQFIAALADPNASSGNNAHTWALWRLDPGPRGVWLKDYETLEDVGGFAPAGWQHDKTDWWLDENGLIMEKPVFDLPAGKYMVTGDRETKSVLTIHPKDENGFQGWELADNVRLFDVTHLPCRSARYKPLSGESSCSPANAPIYKFKITPGTKMPEVEGCYKQDYAVLFVIGVEDK